MYIADFEEFQAAAVKLFSEQPKRTRYTLKFRGVDQVVVLKVTDDRVTLKHKIKVQRDLNKKLEQFNNVFLRLAATN